MAVVTLTGHPKSVRNCCAIEVFDGVFVLSLDFCADRISSQNLTDIFPFSFNKVMSLRMHVSNTIYLDGLKIGNLIELGK